MGRNELYKHNQIYLHRSCNTTCITPITFLPLLYRLSTKDAVKISEPKNDPSSPKVGCMGQIKRHNNNNKINNTTTGKLKYTQLKKMFSGRNLLLTTTTTNGTNTKTNTAYCKVGNNNKKILHTSVNGRPKFHNHGRGNCAVVVPLNLAELDPPLPVPCGPGKRGEKESLWKRRGGRVAPIQPIQLPYNNTALLPPSSVS